MSNYSLKSGIKLNQKLLSSFAILSFPYFKIFSTAAFITISLVCVFSTILPKHKLNLTKSSRSDISEIKNSILENNSELKDIPKSDLQSLNKVRKNLSLEELRLAINEGTYSKLSILRPEILGDNLIKETSLLPEVKSLLLNRLIFLMQQNDWVSWKELLVSNNINKSPAREFVDNISTVNFQLGRYLETSALLFSSLYTKTSNGSVFSAEQALYGFLQQSNYLFILKAPKAISTRMFLDTLITDDSTFITHLNQLRVSLFVLYAKKEPNEIETQLILLSTISPEYFTNDITKIYSEILNHVNKKISSRFREEVRSHYFNPEVSKSLVKNNINLSSSIFKLYETVINDSIEIGDLQKAKSNYLQLTSFSDNSNELNSLQTKIDNAEEKLKSNNLEVIDKNTSSDSKNISGIKLFPELKVDNSNIGNTFQAYSLIIALVLFVLILVKRIRVFMFAILIFSSRILLGLIKKNTKNNEKENEDLIDELDASIKSGKTVPMKSVPRNRQINKKAANF
jgi:hypothetical protein